MEQRAQILQLAALDTTDCINVNGNLEGAQSDGLNLCTCINGW